jgi:hypothetical protein
MRPLFILPRSAWEVCSGGVCPLKGLYISIDIVVNKQVALLGLISNKGQATYAVSTNSLYDPHSSESEIKKCATANCLDLFGFRSGPVACRGGHALYCIPYNHGHNTPIAFPMPASNDV